MAILNTGRSSEAIRFTVFLKKIMRRCRKNGVCAICKKKDRKRSCVDHCHGTRTVQALLCTKCNIGLGHFDDDIERLRAAIAYLERVRGKR